MDCYIMSIHKIVGDEQITPAELAFMTNYTVTRAWIDTAAATTFDVPVIYPSWFPNVSEVQTLYPQLQRVKTDTFCEYIALIRQRVKEGPVVTAVDRYHLSYITPRRHMGAHYIVIHDVLDAELKYFDPFDQQEHVMTVSDLKLWTAPFQPAVQYMGYVVLFVDSSVGCSYSSSAEELSFSSILARRIELIRSTIQTIRGFRHHSVSSTRALRFFLKLALGGMSYSDFNARNGRLENREFFMHHNMPVSAVIENGVISYYRLLFKVFSLMYVKKFEITRSHWLIFLSLYIGGLRLELFRYQFLQTMCKRYLCEHKISDIAREAVA
ncbi:hypothetical protein AIF0345_2030 [Actinomyces israelii]|nr:hypothetical protein AIF0345_2030 [Actinomyces israelii]